MLWRYIIGIKAMQCTHTHRSIDFSATVFLLQSLLSASCLLAKSASDWCLLVVCVCVCACLVHRLPLALSTERWWWWAQGLRSEHYAASVRHKGKETKERAQRELDSHLTCLIVLKPTLSFSSFTTTTTTLSLGHRWQGATDDAQRSQDGALHSRLRRM